MMTKTHAAADSLVVIVGLIVYGVIAATGHDGNDLLLLLGGYAGRAGVHTAADAWVTRGAA